MVGKMNKKYHIAVCLNSGISGRLSMYVSTNYDDLIKSLKGPHYEIYFQKVIYVNPEGKLHFIVSDNDCDEIGEGARDFRKQLVLDSEKLSDELTFALFHDISKLKRKKISIYGGLREEVINFLKSNTVNDKNELTPEIEIPISESGKLFVSYVDKLIELNKMKGKNVMI